MLPVFLSVTTPHTPGQEQLVRLLETALADVGLQSHTLGRNEWSFEAPLIPIRQMMLRCQGTVALALVRTLVTEGVDNPHGTARPFQRRYLATPWTHIETAMAFQLGQPILVLRQEEVEPEGILDPAGSGLFIRSFRFDEAHPSLPAEVLVTLPAFAARVAGFAAGS
jgi:hypothetical protein